MITNEPKNILVVDDSMFFRKKLGDILTEAGHKVEYARNGMEAVETLKASPGAFDLMTLDLDLPDLNGFQVLAWLRDMGRKGSLHVIVISSIYQAGGVQERLRRLGASDFLTKAFSPQELILHCNRLLFPDKAAAGVSPRERVPVSIPADFTAGGATLDGFILNVSKTGAYLHADAGIKTGETLRLRFTLPGMEDAIEAEGIVRWTTDEKGRETKYRGGGVMFTAISPASRQAIETFVNEEAERLGFKN
ncbi:MAG: response regulator [Deltaproteobacteria bacterium]|nr:response regulator [Deltaproteobacteria bacterium]